MKLTIQNQQQITVKISQLSLCISKGLFVDGAPYVRLGLGNRRNLCKCTQRNFNSQVNTSSRKCTYVWHPRVLQFCLEALCCPQKVYTIHTECNTFNFTLMGSDRRSNFLKLMSIEFHLHLIKFLSRVCVESSYTLNYMVTKCSMANFLAKVHIMYCISTCTWMYLQCQTHSAHCG